MPSARTRSRTLGAPCILALGALVTAPLGVQQAATIGSTQTVPPISALPSAAVTYDSDRELLTITLPPADLPAAGAGMEGMVMSPIYQAVIPVTCTAYSARATVVDAQERSLPLEFLHHFDLADPAHRDLFQPIALHILAMSKETPPMTVPRLLLGLPFTKGARLITWAGLHNASSTPHAGAHVRVELGCRRPGRFFASLLPVFRGYPWVMDVMFPAGRRAYSFKLFDLPPGRFTMSTDARPAVPGTIVGVGGHLHDYGVGLELRDVTANRVLWQVAARRDAAGHVLDIPITTFYNWHRLGLHITPTHVYRITAIYDNPTGHVIPAGGMGTVAGLFVPDRGTEWPQVDPSNPAYVQDMLETFGIGAAGKM